MRKSVSFLVGVMLAGAGAFGQEHVVVLDPICPAGPQTVLAQGTFCNSNAINLPAAGVASLYPSIVAVSGLTGVVSEVKVRLLGVTHANTSTVQAVLQPPAGPPVGLTGTSFAIANPLPPAAPIPLPVAASAQWTFSDRANDYALFLQQGMPVLNATAPISGTYLPRTFTTGALPAPAPAALESQLLSSQVGRNPNGNWQLFVNQQTLSAIFRQSQHAQAAADIAGPMNGQLRLG